MGFKEYFLANELKLRGAVLMNNPLVPTEIPKTGFVNSGARKMNMMAPVQPYKPKPHNPLFRMGKSSLKS